jgi:hypothetical protein
MNINSMLNNKILLICSSIILGIFIIINIPHWFHVLHLPVYYYFPNHEFTIIDADSRGPVPNALVVYLFEYSPILGQEEWNAILLDSAGYAFYVLFLKVSNFILGERIPTWNEPWIVTIREATSDSNGRIVFPSRGPIHRRRNNYFKSSGAPICFILKPGYASKILVNQTQRKWASNKIFPSWAAHEVTLEQLSAENIALHNAAEYSLYFHCKYDYRGSKPIESLAPHLSRLLTNYSAERAK